MHKVTGGVLALAGTLLGLWGASAAPPAGTEVPNQAAARMQLTNPNSPGWILSNRVAVTVDTVEVVDLLGEFADSAAAGAPVAFGHRVLNLGNADATITIVAENGDGDDFDFTGLDILWSDVPPEFSPTLRDGAAISQVRLAPGGSADFLVVARVPDGLDKGLSGGIRVTAVPPAGRPTRSRDDRVTVTGQPHLELTKTASADVALPGDTIIFTVEGRNSGNAPALGIPLVVDGAPAHGILVQDGIPPRMRLAGIPAPGTGTALYHAAGADSLSFTTTAPSDPARVDRAGCVFADLAPGGVFHIELAMIIDDGAHGVLENVAEAAYDSEEHAPERAVSNVAVVTLPVPGSEIAYFADGTFRSAIRVGDLGEPVFLQAYAPGCDVDPATADEARIVILSQATGDRETYRAVETGPATGIFRIPGEVLTHDLASKPARENNGYLESVARDVLRAQIEGCPPGGIAYADLYMGGYGIAFDTATERAVPGVTVTLVNAVTGEPAAVYGVDGVTPVSATAVTDGAGRYRFDWVAPGTLRLVLEVPEGYLFPSASSPEALRHRVVYPDASYGRAFTRNGAAPLWADLPLDPDLSRAELVLEKSVLPERAEIGDFVDYTVLVHNEGDKAAAGVTVTDHLPQGFVYETGTARVDGDAVPEPEGVGGPLLGFAVGDVPPGEFVTLTYRVAIGSGAGDGDGVNRARAFAGADSSNTAAARVQVDRGVFTERGYVLGRVVMLPATAGGDPVGIPGVRVLLENGTLSITDADGQFSFYDVSPRTHVLKVDPFTLPPGTRLVPLTERHAGAGGTAFVDLKNGELHHTDFAAEYDPSLEAAVHARRAAAMVLESEIGDAMDAELRPDASDHAPRDARSLPASGLVDAKGDVRQTALPVGTGLDHGNSQLPGPPVAPLASAPLESLLVGATPDPGFLNLADGDVLPAAWTVIQVKGALGTTLRVTRNGEQVPDNRVGKRITDPVRGLVAAEYVGITLDPGENRLELTQIDAFGNPRGGETIRVLAPGNLAALRLDPEYVEAPADGRTIVRFRVGLTDAGGLPVTMRIPVTLDAELGAWTATDLDPDEPGTQVFVEGGTGIYELVTPNMPGDGRVRASSGLLMDDAVVSFVPELRPIMGVGLVEGAIRLRDFSLGELVPTRPEDDFEDVLGDMAWTSDDGQTRADARAALYLKGKVKGSYLLTLAYDSEQDDGTQLFRDIRPDAFYPVYGSSDQRGFDARSTSRLYLRVDKGRSYLLYGDFVTDPVDETQNLGAYRRSLTGAREHYQSDRVAVNAFATHDDSRRMVEEVPALGISGPYRLAREEIVPNSETVEILVRDRNTPDVILGIERKTRFTDYVLDPWTGEVLFRAPVPSLDPNLNQISIRVTYEAAEDTENYWVGGATAAARVVRGVDAGVSFARDENPAEDLTLLSGSLTGHLSEQSTLTAEIAHSESAGNREGDAGRLEWRHHEGSLDARVYGARTGPDFDNPSASVPPGRTEAGGKATYRVSPATRFQGEAIYSEDRVTGGRRQGAYLSVEQRLTDGVDLEVGARHSEDDLAAAADTSLASTDNTTLRGRLSAQVPYLPRLSVKGSYEQSVTAGDRRAADVGGEYQIVNRARLYLRHEFINSLTGPYALNASRRHTTVAGVDADYMRDGHVFSEYRARDAFHGRDAEAAIGLRNQWPLARGVWLHTNLERVHSLANDLDREATVVGGAVEVVRNPGLKATARFEYRTARGTDNYLNTLGLARRLSAGWTLLARNVLSVDDTPSGETGDRFRDRFQIGAAWRDVATRTWDALTRYEFRYEDHEGPGRIVRQHTFSLHVNVRPDSAWTWTNFYAAKLADDAGPDVAASLFTQLYSVRVLRDLGTRWDAGVIGSVLGSRGFAGRRYGVGAELGHMLMDDLWLSLGYNVFGFTDDDLIAENYTERGAYLRLRWKFDETLFGGGGGGTREEAAP